MVSVWKAVLAAVALLPAVGSAAAQQACSEYRVAPGDSLIRIAERAYGDRNRFRVIWEANRDAIGPRPDRVEVGTLLRLPCLDGTLPAEPATAQVPARVRDGTLRIAVIGGMPPLADGSQPGMGLVPELVARAMEGSAPETPVVFTEGGIEGLADGTQDIALPVWLPDCPADPLCAGHAFSTPILTVETAVHAAAALVPGATVCVPAGYLGPDPASGGVLPAGTVPLAAPGMAACRAALEDGRAQGILANPGMVPPDAALAPVPGSSRRAALVAMVPAASAATLRRLDTALRATVDDDWAEVVAGAVAAWRMRLGG